MQLLSYPYFIRKCIGWGPPGRAACGDSQVYDSGLEQTRGPQVGATGFGHKPFEDIGLGGELRLDVMEVRVIAELPVESSSKHAC